jgi:PAS domain S-box-containing protein
VSAIQPNQTPSHSPAEESTRLSEENAHLREENHNLNQELRELENKYSRVLIEGSRKDQDARPLQLLRNAQDGVYFSNASGEVVFINPYLGAILGLGEDEKKIIGKPLPEQVWEDKGDRDGINNDLANYGQIKDRLVIMRNMRSGERVYVSLSSVAVNDPFGKMVGAQHVLCNISSKMRITEELRVRTSFLAVLTNLIAPRQDNPDINKLMVESLTMLLDAFASPAQGAIYLKGENNDEPVQAALLGYQLEGEPDAAGLREAADKVFTSGEAITHTQGRNDHRLPLLAVPLLAEHQVVGALVIAAATKRSYSDTEREMLNVIALGIGWTVKYFVLRSSLAA